MWTFTNPVAEAAILQADKTFYGYIKVWNGSAWVYKPVKYWDGSNWVTKPLKWWDGYTWVPSGGY